MPNTYKCIEILNSANLLLLLRERERERDKERYIYNDNKTLFYFVVVVVAITEYTIWNIVATNIKMSSRVYVARCALIESIFFLYLTTLSRLSCALCILYICIFTHTYIHTSHQQFVPSKSNKTLMKVSQRERETNTYTHT